MCKKLSHQILIKINNAIYLSKLNNKKCSTSHLFVYLIIHLFIYLLFLGRRHRKEVQLIVELLH
jgi:uncharacterized protein YqhQ